MRLNKFGHYALGLVLVVYGMGIGALIQRHRDALFVSRAFHIPSRNFKANVDRGAGITQACMAYLKK